MSPSALFGAIAALLLFIGTRGNAPATAAFLILLLVVSQVRRTGAAAAPAPSAAPGTEPRRSGRTKGRKAA